jgi:hypothetical protein
MSTTDNDGETLSEREPKERPSQRLHDLYRADLRPFEPVSDAQLLGAIARAEVHDRQDDASRSDIAAHLGFAHNSWTTRRLAATRRTQVRRARPRCSPLRTELARADRRRAASTREGTKRERGHPARVSPASEMATLTHARSLTSGSTGSVKRYEGHWPRLALCSTLRKSPRMRGSISPIVWGRRAGSSARPPTACTSGPSPTTHVPTPTRRRGSEDDAMSGNGDRQ